MIRGLDHVQLAAPRGCEDEARRFFGELLGLEEIEKPASLRPRGGVWFAVGAQQLHVGVEHEFAPARKAHPGFAVDDLDALAARLESAGVAVEWDETLPGVRRFYVHDPWGNRLELLQAGTGRSGWSQSETDASAKTGRRCTSRSMYVDGEGDVHHPPVPNSDETAPGV